MRRATVPPTSPSFLALSERPHGPFDDPSRFSMTNEDLQFQQDLETALAVSASEIFGRSCSFPSSDTPRSNAASRRVEEQLTNSEDAELRRVIDLSKEEEMVQEAIRRSLVDVDRTQEMTGSRSLRVDQTQQLFLPGWNGTSSGSSPFLQERIDPRDLPSIV